MLGWLWSLIIVAGAGEPELDVERGLAAMQREAFGEARDLAMSALRDAPADAQAQELYVDATSAAGFGSRAFRELSTYTVEIPAWTAVAAELKESIADGDSKRIKSAFKTLFEDYPDHPELLAPLWNLDTLQGRILEWRIRRRFVTNKARESADTVQLYRIRRLVAQADKPEWVAAVDEELAARGEVPVPSRPPLDLVGRTRYAEQLVSADPPPLAGYVSELPDVVDRAAGLLHKGGRHARAAELYQALARTTGAPSAWAGEAESWRLADQLDEALRVADEAVARATDPRHDDLAANNPILQQTALVRACLARARVHEDRAEPVDANIDLALAHLFAGRILDDKLAERLEDGRRAADASLDARTRGLRDPIEASLSRASTSPDPDVAAALVREALQWLTRGTKGTLRIARDPDAYAPTVARALVALSRAEAARDRRRLARSYLVMATQLVGTQRPDWWAERAAMQSQLGEADAAFHSLAVARGLGVRDLDETLGRTFIGLGEWPIAADQVGGAPPDEPAVIDTGAAPVRRTGAPPDKGPETAPSVGRPMPSFAIPTAEGRLDSAYLRGRMLILSFFTAECDACLQMLPQFGTVARRLRGQGRDAVLIGVSIDEDPADFERIARMARGWGTIVHEPELGRRFGVDRLPATWLIDAGGIARFYVDHWFSGDELLDYVREMD